MERVQIQHSSFVEVLPGRTVSSKQPNLHRLAADLSREAREELRGSPHRFSAVRGTMITRGSFSSGTKQAAFERGAAPITLIDGEKLLDLLRQHEIGVSKQAIEYFAARGRGAGGVGVAIARV